jgi:rod shape-determining protein MreD
MATGGQSFRLARFIWAVAPCASILICIFLMLLPYGQVAGRFVTPALPLIPIYYWTIHRPELVPPVLIFALGLLHDFAAAGPVGVWPVVYLIAYVVTLSQRGELEGLSMRFAALAFTGVALVGLLCGWFAYSIYMGGFVSVLPMVFQALTTALLFPILGWLLMFIEGEIAVAMRH